MLKYTCMVVIYILTIVLEKSSRYRLASNYKDDADIRLHVRMCSSLAHILIDNIDEGWIIIMSVLLIRCII
jgi:hypothetical protein